jgi:hypothetical protein
MRFHWAFVVALCSFACSSRHALPVIHPDENAARDAQRPTQESAAQVFTQSPPPTTEEFALAHMAYNAGEFLNAARRYESLARQATDSHLAAQATFWAALAHEQAGNRLSAAQRFEALSEEHPSDDLAREARIRAVRLWIFRGQFDRARRLAARALEQADELTARQLVAAHSACALAALDSGDVGTAEAQITRGRRVVTATGMDRLDVISRDLAQLYYALGETRRIRARMIRFDPFPPDFALQFERRAQALLAAQDAYLDAMRARDAHWSSLAGYRVGQLYADLHEDVMNTPPPPGLEHNDAFHGAFRLRYLILLEKGLAMYERTVSLAERTGQHSIWSERAQTQARKLRKLLNQQQAYLDALPFSRADLQRILDRIQERQIQPPTRPGDH